MHRINMIAGRRERSKQSRRAPAGSYAVSDQGEGIRPIGKRLISRTADHNPPGSVTTIGRKTPLRLAELLLKESMVSPQQLQDALNHQKMKGGKLVEALVCLGFVKDEEITSLLSRQYGVPSINLDHFEVDPAIIQIIPVETARKYRVLPLSLIKNVLVLATADPTDISALDDIRFMTGHWIEPVVASEVSLESHIEHYYGSGRAARPMAQPDQVDERPYPPVAPLDVGQFLLRCLPCVHVLHVADDGEATLYTYAGALHVEETGFARDHGLSPGRYEGEATQDGRLIWHRLTLA